MIRGRTIYACCAVLSMMGLLAASVVLEVYCGSVPTTGASTFQPMVFMIPCSPRGTIRGSTHHALQSRTLAYPLGKHSGSLDSP